MVGKPEIIQVKFLTKNQEDPVEIFNRGKIFVPARTWIIFIRRKKGKYITQKQNIYFYSDLFRKI